MKELFSKKDIQEKLFNRCKEVGAEVDNFKSIVQNDMKYSKDDVNRLKSEGHRVFSQFQVLLCQLEEFMIDNQDGSIPVARKTTK